VKSRRDCHACEQHIGQGTTATLRLTGECSKNLSALSGVAYEKLGAIFPSLVAPKPAPTPMTSDWVAIGAQSGPSRWRPTFTSSRRTSGELDVKLQREARLNRLFLDGPVIRAQSRETSGTHANGQTCPPKPRLSCTTLNGGEGWSVSSCWPLRDAETRSQSRELMPRIW